MPDAQPQQPTTPAAALAAFEQLFVPILAAVPAVIPAFPRLPQDEIPNPDWARAYTKSPERALDVPGAEAAFARVDRALDAAHDVAVAVFQRWLDRLKGHAAPTVAHNRALVTMILDRVDRYGLGLYYHHHGEMRRVRLMGYPTLKPESASPESAMAGFFSIATSADPSDKSVAASMKNRKIGAQPYFPQLFVARSAAQAEAVLQERGRQLRPRE